jgi:hypothetical protein
MDEERWRSWWRAITEVTAEDEDAPHFRKGLTQRLSDRHPTHMTVPFFSYKIVMALRPRHHCHILRVSW